MLPGMQNGLVVEDLPVPAQWLHGVLTEAFPEMVVRTAVSLEQGRAAIASCVPDIALVDLGLPDGSGIELIRDLATRHPQCHCVVTTIYTDDRHLFPALRAGASGYLLKDQPKDKVIQALRGIVAGEPPLSPVIAQRLLRIFGGRNDARVAAEAEVRLSNRERETLLLIAKGYKLPEVAERLGITRNTAAGFVKSIYRKLNVSSRAEATLEAARMGLIDPHL